MNISKIIQDLVDNKYFQKFIHNGILTEKDIKLILNQLSNEFKLKSIYAEILHDGNENNLGIIYTKYPKIKKWYYPNLIPNRNTKKYFNPLIYNRLIIPFFSFNFIFSLIIE